MATPDSPQANGLMCWLRCDEASGNLIDSSQRGYDAATQGNISYLQTGKPTLGLGFGVAPTTSGAIAIVGESVNNQWSSLLFPAVSVQAWFKASVASFSVMWGTKHVFASKSSTNGDTYGWFLGVLPGGSNTVSFRVMDAATSPYTASYVETDFTQFHHYVGTFDTVNVKLYRDGVLVATTFVSGTIGQSTAYLATIGEGIQGTLDDVAIWNRGLTATEVLRLYGDPAFWKTTQKIRGDVFFPYGNGTLATDALHQSTITVGPFPFNVVVYAGDEDAANPLTAPNDQWVVDGVNWTTPAWVNTSTPHIIAVGTILKSMTAGQTMTLQLRQKDINSDCYGYGQAHVKRTGIVGEGLNIVLLTGQGVEPLDGSVSIAQEGDPWAPVMNDGLIDPANVVPAPFSDQQVNGDFTIAASSDPLAGSTSGVDQNFALFENVLQDPLPTLDSISADINHLVTLVGSAGPSTNVKAFDLYFEVEVSTGMLTIPVDPSWLPVGLPTRLQYTTTYQIPTCISLQFRRARFVAQANGPGASEQAIRWYSAWVNVNSDNFNHQCGVPNPPKLPLQTWSYFNVTTPISPVTPAGCLLALKNAFDAWGVGAWGVDLYVAGHYLTLKRKISAGGVADSFRVMVFAGLPAQSALAGNNPAVVPAAVGALYIGTSELAGATAPTDPAIGPPWADWSGGVGMGGTFGTLSGIPGVFLCSCDRMVSMVVYGDNGWSVGIAGELVVDLGSPAVGIWGCIASGPTLVNPSSGLDAVLASPIPLTAGTPCFGTFYRSGAQQRILRAVAIPGVDANQSPLYDGTEPIGYLMPIVVQTGSMSTATRTMVGTLRQICIGPYQTGRKDVRDGSNNPRAVFLNGGSGLAGSGLYLSQDA